MTSKQIFKAFFWPIFAFVMITLAVIEFNSLNYSWTGWGLASCYPGCFCEAFRPGGIVQPLSSYSNLFYILVGLLILGALNLPIRDGKNNLMNRVRGYPIGFGIAIIAIGATSLFFHVSLTEFGRWLDYMGMYAFVAFALMYSLTRLFGWKGRTFAILYVILLAVFGALYIAVPEIRRPLLGGLILAVILAEILAHWVRRPLQIKTGYFVASLACFLVAYAINMSDEVGALCVPESPWQWHAVWHLLTAVSTGLLYLYYRSEDETSRRKENKLNIPAS
jgi:dihydroceramidase